MKAMLLNGIFNNPYVNQAISYLNDDPANLTEEQGLSSFDMNDEDWIEVQDPSFLELEKFDWTSEEEPLIDDSESPTSVPEPTSALGLFAIGAWGIIKALKIRFDRSALKKFRLG